MLHNMYVSKVYDDGSEEWVCPVCGRTMILHWPPQYSRKILIEGDPSASHSGEKSGLFLTSNPDGEYSGPEDEYDQWLKGLK